MEHPGILFYPAVAVYSLEAEGESAAEIAPLTDALKEEFHFVRVWHHTLKPPLAGGDPTVMTLVSFVQHNWEWFVAAGGLAALGIGKYASAFMEELGKRHAGRIDDQLAKLVGRKKPADDGQGRNYVLVAVQIEELRLAFDETIERHEYQRRYAEAVAYLATLPDSAFEKSTNPPERDWHYWNPVTQNWQNGRYISPEEQERLERHFNPKGRRINPRRRSKGKKSPEESAPIGQGRCRSGDGGKAQQDAGNADQVGWGNGSSRVRQETRSALTGRTPVKTTASPAPRGGWESSLSAFADLFHHGGTEDEGEGAEFFISRFLSVLSLALCASVVRSHIHRVRSCNAAAM